MKSGVYTSFFLNCKWKDHLFMIHKLLFTVESFTFIPANLFLYHFSKEWNCICNELRLFKNFFGMLFVSEGYQQNQQKLRPQKSNDSI